MSRIFLSTPLENQIRHMNLIRDADKDGQRLATQVDTREFEAITEISVLDARSSQAAVDSLPLPALRQAPILLMRKSTRPGTGRALDSIFINREHDKNDG